MLGTSASQQSVLFLNEMKSYVYNVLEQNLEPKSQ